MIPPEQTGLTARAGRTLLFATIHHDAAPRQGGVVLLWASGNTRPKAGHDILELSPPFLAHPHRRADPPRGNDALDLGGLVQALEDFAKE
jgi:hypothetical protein